MNKPAKPAILVENLTVIFGDQIALDNVTFTLYPGEYVGLIGPNGAGKSTLLKAILGLTKPHHGKVQTYPKQQIGYIPQHNPVNPNFSVSVAELLETSTHRLGLLGKKDPGRDSQVLQYVDLDQSFLARDFNTLSGGQKQRVLIARSLYHRPQLLLFDEPLSGVDYSAKIQIYDLLADLNVNLGLSILFVSHEVEHINSRCNRILCLNRHLHEGCHPMEFVQQKVKPYQTEDQQELIHIHHHHDHNRCSKC